MAKLNLCKLGGDPVRAGDVIHTPNGQLWRLVDWTPPQPAWVLAGQVNVRNVHTRKTARFTAAQLGLDWRAAR